MLVSREKSEIAEVIRTRRKTGSSKTARILRTRKDSISRKTPKIPNVPARIRM